MTGLRFQLFDLPMEDEILPSPDVTTADPAPTETFAWWCWLAQVHTVEQFVERLDRSSLRTTLPVVEVERSVQDDQALDWSFHALVHGERVAMPQQAFRAPSRLVVDEFWQLAQGHAWMAGCSGTGKSSLLRRMLLTPLRRGQSVLVGQDLGDFAQLARFTPDDLLVRRAMVTLDAWLLRHHRVDLLDALVVRSGGWTRERYRNALDGLMFLQTALEWPVTVQRWAEGASLRLAMPHDVPPTQDVRRRL